MHVNSNEINVEIFYKIPLDKSLSTMHNQFEFPFDFDFNFELNFYHFFFFSFQRWYTYLDLLVMMIHANIQV
jgi:hypothetical protein